jgi:hypothetical protein
VVAVAVLPAALTAFTLPPLMGAPVAATPVMVTLVAAAGPAAGAGASSPPPQAVSPKVKVSAKADARRDAVRWTGECACLMKVPFSVIREGRRQIRRGDLALGIDIEVMGLRPLPAVKGSALLEKIESRSAS